MTLPGLVLRSLLHHWRLHLGVLLGTALAATVLCGALLVGESVDQSLRSSTDARLGRVRVAMVSGRRLLDASAADRLEEILGEPVAPLLRVQAVALRRGEDGHVVSTTGVTLYGVDERFASLAPRAGATPHPGDGEVLLNARAARELGVAPGDLVSLRIGALPALPLDAPLSSRGDGLTRLGSFDVAAVLGPEGLGDLNLHHEQLPPANAFVDAAWLHRVLERPSSANLLLSGASPSERVQQAFTRIFEPGLLGYRTRPLDQAPSVQLEAERVFLEPAVARAALAREGAVGSLTWLVDALAVEGGASTPYSFVTAVSPTDDPALGPVPLGMGDDEIIVNAWTAAELGLGVGDEVQLSWSMPTASGAYRAASRGFRVHSVLAMDELSGERERVPGFPGLTDVDRCGDWDIGLPLDPEHLRDEANERYWLEYRQTPKAFVTLAAGRAMWSSRWGDLTAVRYRPERAPSLAELPVAPAELGLEFQPVAEQAERSLTHAIDFGGLFLGMSVFIIAAVLVLVAMLHAFAVQQRRVELGTLEALGFSGRQLASILLAEAGLIALVGATLGSLGGGGYTRAMIHGLQGRWSEAVASSEISFHSAPQLLLFGALGAVLASLGAIGLTLACQRRRPLGSRVAPGSTRAGGRRKGWAGLVTASLLIATSLASLVAVLGSAGQRTSWFFAAGGLLLFSALALLDRLLGRVERPLRGGLGLGSLALRNAARRRWRSLGATATFAIGCFVVVSVASMSGTLPGDGDQRWSGTGGFATYAETVLPLAIDTLGSPDPDPGNALVPLRVRDGDDASCRNLQRAQAPRLLGVDPELLAQRRAFEAPGGGRSLWDALQRELSPGVVPGLVGDQDTALWNLGVRVDPVEGDQLDYLDDQGRPLRVQLVGALPVRKSILQGAVLISEEAFTAHFPSEPGYRALLVDPGDPGAAAGLAERFESQGLVAQDASLRLAGFYAVEHSYLRIFALLGGLGLVLGSLGMGVVVLRNLAERREELSMLATLGFSAGALARLLFLEHALLFAAGMVGGTVAALLAVAPILMGSGGQLALRGTLGVLAAALILGLAWIALLGTLGGRWNPLASLREE